MTPEEGFARMRDTSAWKVRARVTSMVPRRESRPLLQWGVIVAGAVVAALVIGGFATFVRTHAPQDAPAAPVPTQTAMKAAPAVVFGGDCSAVWSAADVAAILGPDARRTTLAASGEGLAGVLPSTQAARNAGGMICDWTTPAHREFAALVFPAGTAPDAYATGGLFRDGACADTCLQIDEDGYQLTAIVVDSVAHSAQGDVTFNAVVDPFRIAAAKTDAPAPRVLSGWPSASSCASVAEKSNIAAIVPGGVAISAGSTGALNNLDPLLVNTGLTLCDYTMTSSQFVIHTQALAGGAWLEPDIAALPLVTKVRVVGADAAYSYHELGADSTWIFAITGGDLLALTVPVDLDGAELSAALISGFNALR